MIRWSNLGKHTTVLFLVLAIGLALVLFSVKHQVQNLEHELAQLSQRIAAERQTTHVLRAEFSYLTDTDRLRTLSLRHLDLQPVQPRQVGSFAVLVAAPDRDAAAGDAQRAPSAVPVQPAAAGAGER
ncbi:MAG: hypothetical protein ACFCUO_07785 [Rhodospirillales bacterium]